MKNKKLQEYIFFNTNQKINMMDSMDLLDASQSKVIKQKSIAKSD